MTTLRAKTNNFLLKHRKADSNIYAILILSPDADVAIVIRHQVEVKHVIKPLSAANVNSCTFFCQHPTAFFITPCKNMFFLSGNGKG